jgi:hypothetical protein
MRIPKIIPDFGSWSRDSVEKSAAFLIYFLYDSKTVLKMEFQVTQTFPYSGSFPFSTGPYF